MLHLIYMNYLQMLIITILDGFFPVYSYVKKKKTIISLGHTFLQLNKKNCQIVSNIAIQVHKDRSL